MKRQYSNVLLIAIWLLFGIYVVRLHQFISPSQTRAIASRSTNTLARNGSGGGEEHLKLESTKASTSSNRSSTLAHPNVDDSGRKRSSDRRADSSSAGLWIYGASWREGVSHWRTSIAEVMMLAKKVNATIVEPDIKDGRLVPPGTGNLPLFDLFDRSYVEKYHGMWATAEQYSSAFTQTKSNSSHKIFDWCIARRHRPTCSAGAQYDAEQLKYSSALETALQEQQASKSTNISMVILRLEHMWCRSFYDLRLEEEPHKLIVPEEEVENIVRRNLRFSEKIYNLADQSLATMNISSSEQFALVHWRAELADMDYDSCANDIVLAKNAMAVPEGAPFVLMSSLSLDDGKIWGGARTQASNSTAKTALSNLIDKHHFRMSDQGLPEQKDLVIYAAVDILLAQKALSFSTCTRSCKKPYDSCKACNHRGDFAQMALEYRREEQGEKGSWPCWPRHSSEKNAIDGSSQAQ